MIINKIFGGQNNDMFCIFLGISNPNDLAFVMQREKIM